MSWRFNVEEAISAIFDNESGLSVGELHAEEGEDTYPYLGESDELTWVIIKHDDGWFSAHDPDLPDDTCTTMRGVMMLRHVLPKLVSCRVVQEGWEMKQWVHRIWLEFPWNFPRKFAGFC